MNAILISIKIKKQRNQKRFLQDIEELEKLCSTAYLNPSFLININIENINPAFFIGYGKAEEIKEIIKEKQIKIAVFNQEINSTQQRNLEKLWGIDVIDRTFLILKIFQQRAKTAEGKLQVEMARLKYSLSRISGFGEELDQQVGMIGTRGAGEKKIEYSKRVLRDKIAFLKKELNKIQMQRNIQRYKRQSIPMPQVSIVGYTNSGKSTLLNSLTDNKYSIYSDDKLFATLDPLTKKVKLGIGTYILISDTVGFINNLPHTLIAAFRSTLEEIKFSDLIIHLHDITSPYLKNQIETVKKTIDEIGAGGIPIINVFNKIDSLKNLEKIKSSLLEYNPIFISAIKKIGFDKLMQEIEFHISQKWKKRNIIIPYKKSFFISKIREIAIIKKEEYSVEGINIQFNATEENYQKIKKMLNNY